ncbi:type II secretion system protein [Candidatus Daviesbacteria bacterium]|nr:type II secretion system protein [Candidatus Daviesbacteria bacterium]
MSPVLPDNQKGFSLVEILIVTLIAGAAIVVLSNLPSAFNWIGNSRKESVAKDIAVKKIEDLRRQTYTNLANTSDPPPQINDLRISSLPQGQAVYIITDCPVDVCSLSEAAKKVTAKVTWQEKSETKKVEITTLIADGGLK